MRNLDTINHIRADSSEHYGSDGDSGNGVFMVTSKIDHSKLVVVASNGGGWDHVSVSHRKRVPNWYEMEQIKAMFFQDDETCMQLHVPATDHINNHPNVLHLWRPHEVAIPRPPSIMVGMEGVTNVTPGLAKKLRHNSLVMSALLAASMAQ